MPTVELVLLLAAESGGSAADHPDISDPTFFALYENWETVDLHNSHMETPHLQDFGGRLDDLLDGSLNVHQMRRIA